MTFRALRHLRWLVFVLVAPSCGLAPLEPDNKVFSIEVFGNSEVKANESITLHTLLKNKAGSTISGGFVTWSSSNPTFATVGSSTGIVTGVQEGAVLISASADGASGSKAILVTSPVVGSITVTGPASIKLYDQGTFVATVKDAGGHVINRPVTWTSSNPAKASISVTGVVNAEAEGSVTISAAAEGVTGTAQLTIAPPAVDRVEVTGTSSLQVGQSQTFGVHLYDAGNNELTGRAVTWSTSAPGIATVSGGTVTGVANGTANITATSEGKSGLLSVTVTTATQFVTLRGRVIDAVTNLGLGSAAVDLIRASDQSTLAVSAEITQGDGSFTTGAFVMPAGGVYVRASKSGYVTGRILVAPVNTTLNNAIVNIESVPLVPSSGQPGGIAGVVRNARTGFGIAGASLALYNNLTNTPVAPSNSDANGAYSFTGIAAGTYRVAATAPGFQLTERVGIAVGNNGVTGNQDIVLSPTGTSDIRIVLTWGASPNDLDSHLTGPNADASRFHVYYASRGNFVAAPFAGLDVDDVSGYGPETISITQMNSGNFRYSVHDFTNRNSASSTALGNSGGKVQVYTSTGLYATFSVPGGAGNLWTVFELTGTLANPVITPVQQLGIATDPGSIPSPPAIVGLPGIGGNDAELIRRTAKERAKPKS